LKMIWRKLVLEAGEKMLGTEMLFRIIIHYEYYLGRNWNQ
jgi:hypothetical protein